MGAAIDKEELMQERAANDEKIEQYDAAIDEYTKMYNYNKQLEFVFGRQLKTYYHLQEYNDRRDLFNIFDNGTNSYLEKKLKN